MKSDETHLFANKHARLANVVEQEFFRIERENRWLAGAINGAIAGAAVALIEWLVTTTGEGDLLLFACLGASAASVVFAPLSKNNSLRTIILAYLIASAVCLVLFPIHRANSIPLTMQCFIAVSVPIFLMRLFDSMHPAAIGAAMAFIIYDRDINSLMILMLAIIGLLTLVKFLAYVYLEDLEFRSFPREFRRDYYGRELTLTLDAETGRQHDNA